MRVARRVSPAIHKQRSLKVTGYERITTAYLHWISCWWRGEEISTEFSTDKFQRLRCSNESASWTTKIDSK